MLNYYKICKFPIQKNELQLIHSIRHGTFCEAVGNKSAALGYEQGVFEIWVYPFKILHDLKFSFLIEKYNQTINGTDIAKQIIVRPELTTILYSHDLFTMHQHLLAPIKEPGVIIFADISTYCPLTIIVSFVPDLVPMWPAGLGGQYTLWLNDLQAYFIGEGSRKYVGLVGSPMAKRLSGTPGHQLPDAPMQMAFEITPDIIEQQFLPLIITSSAVGKENAIGNYQKLLQHVHELYSTNYQYYHRLKNDFMSIQTPNQELDLAFEWSKIALDKGFVDNPHLGKGLVAGYGIARNTQRPGFAWFFGGDTFLNAYAINDYGNFEMTKQALIFFCNHQRQDGKIPHECTQSATLIDWFGGYPYAFYHGDTTPYFIIAVHNYVIFSGDESFLKEYWDVVEKAYQYCLSADTDNDGLMENTAAGLAAMEVGMMLSNIKIDVYLACVWLKALKCMAELAQLVNRTNIIKQSKAILIKAINSFREIFIDNDERRIYFALLEDGNKISEPTVWQSIPFFLEIVDDEQGKTTLEDLASPLMSTDWGVRGVSAQSQHFDPISYNNGSVWPFTTGYVAVAEYLQHRHLHGFAHLFQNVYLTQIDALGWHPELLSGEFYRPINTAVPHQLFSATGIIHPLVRGLLGLRGNALTKEINFSPHLPLSWNQLIIKTFRVGEDSFNFSLYKSENSLKLEMTHQGKNEYQLIFSPALGFDPNIIKAVEYKHLLEKSLKKIKYDILHFRYDTHCQVTTKIKKSTIIEITYHPGLELEMPIIIPQLGDRTQSLKLIDYHFENKILFIKLEGIGGKSYHLKIRTRFGIKAIEGGVMVTDSGIDKVIELKFESENKNNYQRKNVKVIFM